ncbi:MAG: outer membrane protein assembly factor BamD [Prevotella sp.]|nr:outer membrane protein assembly factor BamD [Prevotella sp.]
MAVVCMTGCSEYTRVMKSHDINVRYDYAKKAYEEGKYVQASTILTDLITPLKGSAKGEEALYLLGMSYYKNKDFLNSGVYLKSYYNRYPKGMFTEDARYYCGYGYYLDSPDPQLDQSETLKGIEELQGFIDYFPKSERIESARNAMFELQDKLTLKELQNAELYYNLGTYMGNNYESCVIVADNALRQYPYSKYREDLEFLKLKAKYQEARQSVSEKQKERYRDVIDEYYSFVNNFPESKNRKEADDMFRAADKHIKN